MAPAQGLQGLHGLHGLQGLAAAQGLHGLQGVTASTAAPASSPRPATVLQPDSATAPPKTKVVAARVRMAVLERSRRFCSLILVPPMGSVQLETQCSLHDPWENCKFIL